MKVIKIGPIRMRWAPALFIFAGLYLWFMLADLASSKQTGNVYVERGMAHLSLMALVGYLSTYVASSWFFLRRRIKLTPILCSLIALSTWIFVENAFYGNFSWTMLIILNMSILWILSYIFFYFQTLKNSTTVYGSVWFFFLIYMIASVYYFIHASFTLNRIPVLNIAYCVLAFLPFIFTKAGSFGRCVACLLMLGPVLLSMKRGAYIALPIMLFAENWVRSLTQKDLFKRILIMLVLAGLLIAGFYMADFYSDGFISSRFSYEQLADGSGRRNMYALAWKDILHRPFGTLLTGTGAGSSIQAVGTGIHNEWLEFLFSYGLIGLGLYTLLIISMLVKLYYALRSRSPYAPAVIMMCSLYLLLSMISTGYGGYIGLLLFGFWGYLEGLQEQEKIQ